MGTHTNMIEIQYRQPPAPPAALWDLINGFLAYGCEEDPPEPV